MSLWSDLVATALLGTARAPLPALPEPETELGALLGQIPDPKVERQLLAAAALVDVWQRAGARPFPAPGTRALPSPAEDRAPCPPRAAQYLAEMLSGDKGEMLPEWLEALRASDRVLPHRWLPELLELACRREELKVQILPVLGARGRWLAAQHPAWRELVIEPGEEAMLERWESGSLAVRLQVLGSLRAVDPKRARDLLASTLSQERAADRAKLLSALSIGLTMEDEPFLENVLDDRSRAVRAAAAGLLAQLPDTAFSQRSWERMRPLIALETGFLRAARLTVVLPDACDAGMVRDGIIDTPSSGVGRGAWWLLQMLSVVPCALWSRAWDRSPKDLVDMAGKADHGGALLEGWANAARLHGDGDWALALLQRWAESPWEVSPSRRSVYWQEGVEALVNCVPQAQLEAWFVASLRARLSSLAEAESLRNVLLCHRRQWGEALTRAVLDGLRLIAHRSRTAWSWRAAMEAWARYASPGLADAAEHGWPAQGNWTDHVDRFVAVLRFRRDMLAALDEKENPDGK